MAARSPSPEGRAESREARTGVGSATSPPGSRPKTPLPLAIARGLRKRLTPQEAKLWVALSKLRPAGFHFRRQVAIGHAVVDFACLKHALAVEADGGQHGADDHALRDRLRDEALAARGFRVLRFWNIEVDRNLAGVMDTIVAAPEAARPHPGPPLRSGSALPSGEGERA